MLIQNYSDGFLLSQTLMSHEQMLAAGGDIIPYIREYHAYFDLIRVRK
jgi:hypothetical protein